MNGRGAADLLAGRAARSGAPVTVTFQVTDRCNYDCVHCYETHGDAEELSFAEIDRILGEIADEGTLFLTLTGGEFFMRRDAEEILRAARRRKFAVKLLTTGWFVTDERADLIAELGAIQVDLSFYAGDPTIHDHVTQIVGSWRRTIEAARRLRARGVIVVLKAPMMAANIDGVDEIAAAAADLDCSISLDPKITAREDGDLGPTRLRASDEALRRFYQNEQVGVWQTVEANHAARQNAGGLDETPCRAGHDVCGINPQGMVTACHAIPRWAGDLKTQSFRDIWRRSPEMLRMRGLTWALIDECNRCDVRVHCSRCHATALLDDGKLDGPSREACRHAVILRDLLRERGVVSASDTALPPPLAGPRIRPPALRVLS